MKGVSLMPWEANNLSLECDRGECEHCQSPACECECHYEEGEEDEATYGEVPTVEL